jgi:hypothetical protein
LLHLPANISWRKAGTAAESRYPPAADVISRWQDWRRCRQGQREDAGACPRQLLC